MKTFNRKIKDIKTKELGASSDCPLPIEVIPNKMGINLCSVDSISWQITSDGQLANLTIYFIPNERPDTAMVVALQQMADIADPTDTRAGT